MADARFPGPPEFPSQPPGYPRPGQPGWPGFPPGGPGSPDPGQAPSRVWVDPHLEWQDKIAERLLAKRIVLASGILDDAAASRLSAQLLTLDAEGDDPIRLELQNLRAELSAALTVMGVLDTVRVLVHAYASGETSGAALGVLVSCPRRCAYPNASFTLTEPRAQFGGTVTAVAEREQQVRRMTDSLYYRLAEAAGREADEIRDDARHSRSFTVAEALGYGLIQERVTKSGPTDPA
jgi:ATP-dependent Clp protease protease subunit